MLGNYNWEGLRTWTANELFSSITLIDNQIRALKRISNLIGINRRLKFTE